MEQFEMKFLDRTNEVVLIRRIFARDDGAAMAEAHMGSLSHTLEVWKEDRLVGRIERPRSRTAVAR
jgi:hypothetical protein